MIASTDAIRNVFMWLFANYVVCGRTTEDRKFFEIHISAWSTPLLYGCAVDYLLTAVVGNRDIATHTYMCLASHPTAAHFFRESPPCMLRPHLCETAFVALRQWFQGFRCTCMIGSMIPHATAQTAKCSARGRVKTPRTYGTYPMQKPHTS